LVADEVASLKNELEKEKKTSEEYLNKLQYLQAEFENYKKRSKREMVDAIAFGNQKLITELLTVVDELEYAIDAGKSSNNKTALIHGVEITLKKLYGILDKEGLSRMEALGKAFNPFHHEVVERLSGGDGDERIIEEIRAGFTLKGKVIRPSLVKVARQSPNTSISLQKGDEYE
jgi:molecular chaperone GrpE